MQKYRKMFFSIIQALKKKGYLEDIDDFNLIEAINNLGKTIPEIKKNFYKIIRRVNVDVLLEWT